MIIIIIITIIILTRHHDDQILGNLRSPQCFYCEPLACFVGLSKEMHITAHPIEVVIIIVTTTISTSSVRDPMVVSWINFDVYHDTCSTQWGD